MQATDLAGHAVYAEFFRGGATVQVLITPEGLTQEYQHVPAMMYRRSIHATAPRATWRSSALPKTAEFSTTSGTLTPIFNVAALQPSDIPSQFGIKAYNTFRLFSQLGTQGYKLRKQLIVVEVSVADMAELRHAKTPYKVLNRVTKSRKALGFNDSLFES